MVLQIYQLIQSYQAELIERVGLASLSLNPSAVDLLAAKSGSDVRDLEEGFAHLIRAPVEQLIRTGGLKRGARIAFFVDERGQMAFHLAQLKD